MPRIELPDKIWEQHYTTAVDPVGETFQVSTAAIGEERLKVNWIIKVLELIVERLNED